MSRQKALYTFSRQNWQEHFQKSGLKSQTMNEKTHVILYTKANCGLCDKMKAQMAQAQCDELYSFEEVDITTEAELFERYRYDIPVLMINGVEAFRHRLQADEFRAYVTSLSQSQT
jgi:glutaredoxin